MHRVTGHFRFLTWTTRSAEVDLAGREVRLAGPNLNLKHLQTLSGRSLCREDLEKSLGVRRVCVSALSQVSKRGCGILSG